MNMRDYPTLDLDTWVPLVEQDLSTFPEHLSSPPVFSWVRVAQSFVFYRWSIVYII